ncbi:MAG TPA: MFS transporter [Solirubrobacterales bacterium]|nr:MFS transporter [Solirubrobacterales bacterium]
MDSRGPITEANRKWWTLGAMCLSMFMIMLDSTVVNVALPSIQKDLDTSVNQLEWVVNGYTLSFAALLVTGGRLGDIFGRRRVFMIGVAVFAISSATAGLAQDATMLIVSRIAEGIGGALMMPATLSIITDAFPAEERGKAIGTWAGISGLALSFGPLAGGFLTEQVTWRAIFYINLPIAALALIAALTAVRESRDEEAERTIDYAGVVLLTVALTSFVLALIEGNEWGWESGRVIGLFAGGAVATVLFLINESRVSAPIVDFTFFRSRNFVGANTVATIISFAMMGSFFFLAIYLQDLLGYSALETGVRFLPTTVVIVIAAPIAGRVADRIGSRWPMVLGLAITALALYLFSRMDASTTYNDLLPAWILLGIGIGLTMSPMSTAAMNAVAVAKAGVASGTLQMFRMMGGTIGVAATGAIFQSKLGDFNPAALATGGPAAAQNFTDALGSAMALGAAVTAVGAVIAALVISGKPKHELSAHGGPELPRAAAFG